MENVFILKISLGDFEYFSSKGMSAGISNRYFNEKKKKQRKDSPTSPSLSSSATPSPASATNKGERMPGCVSPLQVMGKPFG